MCILCFVHVASIWKASPYQFGWSNVKFCSSFFNTTKHYIIVSIILATNCTQIPLIRVDPILFSVQLNISINMRKVRNKLWLDFLIWYNMMTSSNGNIFRDTGHLCGEFTGHGLIPHTKASDAKLWCFSLICALNKRLSKQWWAWRFGTPSHPLWRHCCEFYSQ